MCEGVLVSVQVLQKELNRFYSRWLKGHVHQEAEFCRSE